MRVEGYIGVIVPAQLELGRQALAGMRQWCESHPEIGLNILTESGALPAEFRVPPHVNLIGMINWAPETVDNLRRFTTNIVNISNRSPSPGIPQVINADHEVGRLGVDTFHRRGYRTIAFSGRDDLVFSRQREQGYRERMEEIGLVPEVYNYRLAIEGRLAGRLAELMERDAQVALVCAADNFAREAISCLEDPLRLVPSRLAVLGVDNDILQNALSPVSLSSIRLSGERVGYEAADLVYRISRGAAPPTEPVRISPQGVVTRQSTSALAIEDPLVRQAMELISERIAEFPDVSVLVKAMDTSRRTLETRFRSATGRTLHEELNSARLNRARRLLASTDLTMKEISELVGFLDQRRLSVAFRRATGETPTDYRKRIRWAG